jgi:hypothetical protein
MPAQAGILLPAIGGTSPGMAPRRQKMPACAGMTESDERFPPSQDGIHSQYQFFIYCLLISLQTLNVWAINLPTFAMTVSRATSGSNEPV